MKLIGKKHGGDPNYLHVGWDDPPSALEATRFCVFFCDPNPGRYVWLGCYPPNPQDAQDTLTGK